MTATDVPSVPELIGRIQEMLCEAVRSRGVSERNSGLVITPALKRPIWEMGFEFKRVYPRANGLGDQAPQTAEHWLGKRNGSRWTWDPRKRDHSTLKEYSFDVSWIEYGAEYQGSKPRDFEIPAFKRLYLAFETELGDRTAVLYDFDKLLCARAEIRALLWDSRNKKSKYPQGREELSARLRTAAGGREGYWLLSGWGDDCLEHRVYHKGVRKPLLEQDCRVGGTTE